VLPISGGGEISLEIASSSRRVFSLTDKRLRLISPLDRDINDISSVILQVIPIIYIEFDCMLIMRLVFRCRAQ